MGCYDRWVLPRLTHLAMQSDRLEPYRSRVVGGARGDVVEFGIGSGLNLPFYGPEVRRVTGVDPSAALTRLAEKAAARSKMPVAFLNRSAEELPFEDTSVDTVVTTWSLCTIPDPVKALREARRVLRPSGRLLFVEHGLSPDPGVARWQHRLTPLWRRCAGGCHLDRPIAAIIREAGFTIANLETGYADGPRLMTFLYEGAAYPDR